jgi:hypothetical protein
MVVDPLSIILIEMFEAEALVTVPLAQIKELPVKLGVKVIPGRLLPAVETEPKFRFCCSVSEIPVQAAGSA